MAILSIKATGTLSSPPRSLAQLGCAALLTTLVWANALAVVADPASSGNPSFAEHEVKAAYLLSFPKFVQWPAAAFEKPESPFVIAVLGKDPFGPILDEIVASETIGERRVEIKRVSDANDLKQCHLVFISSSEEAEQARILKTLKGLPILTVSGIEGFAKRGGMINFVIIGSKVRFEINLLAAKKSRLKVSSRLAKLADKIREGTVDEKDRPGNKDSQDAQS